MITKPQKKRIKKILGNHYVSVIQEELRLNGMLNKSGNEYSSSQITNVMNGQAHTIIEDAIFSVTQKKIVEKEELEKQRKEILSS